MTTAFDLNPERQTRLDAERQARLDERLIAIDRVVAALESDRQALTTAQLAERIGMGWEVTQRAVCDLVVAGRFAKAGSHDGRPTYQLATVGRCEWCGLVDHHLIAGECPQCRKRVAAGGRQRIGASSNG